MAKLIFPVPGGTYQNDWGAARQNTGTHKGTDIFAPRGTPILAIVSGVITKIGPSKIGGNRLWINGRWYFAHLDRFAEGLKVGDRVKAGQIIGYVGNTGDAKGTPPHLHLGYSPDGSQGGSWANPYPLLKDMATRAAPAQTATETTATEPTAPAAAAAPDEMAAMATAAPELGDTSTPLSGTGLGPPGSANPSAPPVQTSVAETWRLIASQPLSSPEALRLADLASIAGG